MNWFDVKLEVSRLSTEGAGTLAGSTSMWIEDGTYTLDSPNALSEWSKQDFHSYEERENSRCDIHTGQHGILHVRGDLEHKIVLGKHGELIVGGDVTGDGTVETVSGGDIYIGGNAEGSFILRGRTSIHIAGDLSGEVRTGAPSTTISIGCDLLGEILPIETGHLLYLRISGYSPYSILEGIGRRDYTEFRAYVRECDVEPGFYPESAEHLDRRESRRSYMLVAVHSKSGQPQNDPEQADGDPE